MQPIPPAEDATEDEKTLKRQICIKPRAEKHDHKQKASENASPPGMDSVSARQKNRNGIEPVGCDFPAGIHGSSLRSDVYCTTLPSKLPTGSITSGCPAPKSPRSA